MSDEDILNMPFPSLDDETEADESTSVDEDEPEVEEDDESLAEFDYDDEEETDEEESSEEFDVFSESEEEDQEETSVTDSGSDDYETKYKELLAPFRANGKEIKVETADDLRRLAQMGVGYNAKMAELKPIRKLAKMLENEGSLNEEKINYLIDLSKNNVSAITKLVKDSGINPLDIDTDSAEAYKPNTYTVHDNQLALDEALDDLERTSSGQRVIDLVSTKFDKASKRVLVSNPAYMQQLESHIENGIYDQVMAVVDRERLFNRIPDNLSDLDAYNMIGQQMAQAGAFNGTAPTPQASSHKKAQDDKRQHRKRAASSPKGKRQAPKQIQNVLSMSDEEFEKTLMSKYM